MDVIALERSQRAAPGLGPVAVVAALVLAAACGSSDPPDSARVHAPFECEVQAYPCTWDDVAPEVVTRTRTLAELGALYERSGASIEDVAAFLRDQPGVPYVETTGTGVRFRLEAGRPAWIYPGNELDHHRGEPATTDDIDLLGTASPRSPSATNIEGTLLDAVEQWLVPPAHAQEEPETGVAADEPGNGKRALIVAPFEWQYPGHGHTTAARAERIRDYQPDARGEVVFKADLAEFEENPPVGYDYIDGGVEFEDFLEWDTYNLVVLLSHGTVHYCHSIAPVGGERRVSGQAPDEYPETDECPLIWAGRARQESYGAYVGVEIVEYVNPIYDDHPGLTIGEVVDCNVKLAELEEAGDPGAPEPTTSGGKPCRIKVREEVEEGERLALWTDFFKAQYRQGLQNSVVMLAACRSAVNKYLLDILAPDGNRNISVFGFANSVDAGEGLWLAAELVRLVGRGFHSHDLEDLMGKSDPTKFLIGKTLALGDEPATGPAELHTASPTATHGRDIVLLIDPLGGKELRDGGTVSVLAGAPDEGDQLRIYPQLLGVTESQPSPDAQVEVRVVGEGVPNAGYRPTTAVDEGAFRYEKPVALGRRYQEGERVDLEARIDLPGGGFSRWVYRDIKLVGCYWSATVSGAQSGLFGGASVGLRPGATFNGLRLSSTPEEPDPDELKGLTLSFAGDVEVGSFPLFEGGLSFLIAGHGFPVSNPHAGTVDLIEVERDASGDELALVSGEFTAEFAGRLFMPGPTEPPTFTEQAFTIDGAFVWRPECREPDASPTSLGVFGVGGTGP